MRAPEGRKSRILGGELELQPYRIKTPDWLVSRMIGYLIYGLRLTGLGMFNQHDYVINESEGHSLLGQS